eukprot:gene7022-119_t
MPPTHPVIQAIQDAMPPEGTETYKLYENDVKTLEDVKEYLRTWFIRQPGGYSREWDGAHYTLVMGFRRGYWSHQVFVDTDTGLYIFTCDEEKEIPPFVTGEFSSFEARSTKDYSHMLRVPSDVPLSSISGTFKVYPSVSTAIHIPNVRLEIGPNYMRDLPDHLQTSDLVILDIDHLGKSERDNFKVLEEAKFDGLLIVDDIHLNEHMQRFWDDIKQTNFVTSKCALPTGGKMKFDNEIAHHMQNALPHVWKQQRAFVFSAHT